AEDPRPCPEAQELDCKCPQGRSCSEKSCLSCSQLPRCQPGWEPARIGVEYFRFECKPCENGTYSSGNSWCRNWTDCEGSGFVTLRAGNRTHNSVC
ncbi:TNR18 factor, partial [Hirundo rustica]|nr:TNR18 factor [Hirundo rustica]